eukprot:gb/GECH01009464.1/.p1 GENE.gb/GECH01009464.1/~~gb/GECH01009464.1/.p1  ORF type:complete len:735 (+),score=169.51 gb/GECH01009464.1/:1-2205(+)
MHATCSFKVPSFKSLHAINIKQSQLNSTIKSNQFSLNFTKKCNSRNINQQFPRNPKKFFHTRVDQFYNSPNITKTIGILNNNLCLKKIKRNVNSLSLKNSTRLGFVEFQKLAELCHNIEQESSRNGRIKLLQYYISDILRSGRPNDIKRQELVSTISLLTDTIYSPELGIELRIGNNFMLSVLSYWSDNAESMFHHIGDLGSVAAELVNPQGKKSNAVVDVHQSLQEFCDITGKDSLESRKQFIINLLTNCSDKQEVKYLTRILMGKLRIGASTKSSLQAFSKSFAEIHNISEKELMKMVQAAYDVCSSPDTIIDRYLKSEISLQHQSNGFIDPEQFMNIGKFIQPMLAKPAASFAEAVEQFQGSDFSCERKYDGERAQIHYENGQFYMFSRNGEDTAARYSVVLDKLYEIIEQSSNKIKSFIIDGEIIAVDSNTHELLPFQTLSSRSWKSPETSSSSAIGDPNTTLSEDGFNLCLKVFDLMYLNGSSLLKEPLAIRQSQLAKHFQTRPGILEMVSGHRILSKNNDATLQIESVRSEFMKAVENNCEGIIVKDLNNTYEAGKRKGGWLKLKRDYLDTDGLSDTLDLVPIAGIRGEGRRKGLVGSFLVACRDENEQWQPIAKVGAGVSDDFLSSASASLETTDDKSLFVLSKELEKKFDLWFKPNVVWEIKAAEFTLSPLYTACKSMLHQRKGISLRFPRFLRQRTDKNPQDATSTEQIFNMYQQQKARSKSKTK